MRIAILGTRGTEKYGGFETFVHELTIRLCIDYDIYIFNRHSIFKGPFPCVLKHEYSPRVSVVSVPCIRGKSLDTLTATISSIVYLLILHFKGIKFDHFLVCNGANSPFLSILRILGVHISLNVDGIERLRKKWGILARTWYYFSEYFATKFADTVIADAEVIRDYYVQKFNIDPKVICYGATIPKGDDRILTRLGIEERKYLLYVSRLEPENNADKVIRAFNRSRIQGVKLVIVGDVPYLSEYKTQVEGLAADNPDIIMTGYLFGDDYRSLQVFSLAYIQATEVGGTHPALIEAMASSCLVIANDTPEHREVLSDCGLYYVFNDIDNLAEIFNSLPSLSTVEYRMKALARVQEKYSWSKITQQYTELFRNSCLLEN